MWKALRESSPSFLFAVALVVAAAGGYLGWRLTHPSPRARSERIVRDFVEEASAIAGNARRAFRRAARAPAAEALAAIDRAEREANQRLAQAATEARERLDRIGPDLPWRTLENRIQRIDRREAETRQHLAERARAFRAKIQGQAAAPAR